ncbi:hypothetical protein RhiirA4_538867 [Rhizophagus irregularis]|uniref:Transposase putative helix-turn-helix domain-containing protein n=1 Tax=Rhizophagus irregularis TaxID=588596 RepID=A0A2I1G1G7_9GLOM|nr:hypothetical protein RhiirA4_538867 [Rhizophagus irregularis]
MLRPPPPPPPPPKKVSSTLESLVPSKNKTLNSRNNSSASDFQPMNSSYVDIGSGINFKRPGLKTLLERTNHGMVSVTDSAGSPSTSSRYPCDHTVFICRMQGKRAALHRRERQNRRIKVYPNHSQKQLLKRWMGLARFAYSSVVKWSKSDIQAGINVDKVNYKKLINSAIWGERKFLRAVQRLISKAEEKGIYVIIQNEAYTSKTCSWCGIFRRLED